MWVYQFNIYIYIYIHIYKRLTHKQNMNFTYLLRHYKLFRACALFRCLCKTKISMKNFNLNKSLLKSKLNFFIRFLFLTFPVYIIFYYYNNNVIDLDILIRETNIPSWLFSLCITSQLIFTFRFIFQWIYSENKKESSLPLGFWLLSISGSILILIGYFIVSKLIIKFKDNYFW